MRIMIKMKFYHVLARARTLDPYGCIPVFTPLVYAAPVQRHHQHRSRKDKICVKTWAIKQIDPTNVAEVMLH